MLFYGLVAPARPEREQISAGRPVMGYLKFELNRPVTSGDGTVFWRVVVVTGQIRPAFQCLIPGAVASDFNVIHIRSCADMKLHRFPPVRN